MAYSDTDSFIFHLTTNDMFQDFKTNIDYFDMSEYDPTHPHFGKFVDNTYKKILGKFKDEFANSIITDVACPRPKMYGIRSLKIAQTKDKSYVKEADGTWKMDVVESKKAKGITRAAVKNQIPLADFRNVMVKPIQTYATNIGIRSTKHVVFTEKFVKKLLMVWILNVLQLTL